MTTYPIGTDCNDIPEFNRGIKVAFQCKEHPESKWVSKDPFRSAWFPHHTNVTPIGQIIEDCFPGHKAGAYDPMILLTIEEYTV